MFTVKGAKPTKKSRKPWTAAEDAALIQFLAVHKDKQPTEAAWPAMKTQHEYWTEAAMLNRLLEHSILEQVMITYL